MMKPIHLENAIQRIDDCRWGWSSISRNPSAISFLEQYPEKIYWPTLSSNPAAVHLLKKHPERINLTELFSNPSDYAVEMLKSKFSEVEFEWLCTNQNPCIFRMLDEEEVKKLLSLTDLFILSANPAAIDLLVDLLEKYPDKINWNGLSMNPAAIHLLEQNLDNVHWGGLSANPAAIHLLEQNLDKIDWWFLSKNPAAIHLLEQNPEKINWWFLSENPAAIRLLEQYPEKIELDSLCENPNAMHLLFKLDCKAMKDQCRAFSEELTEYVLKPSRVMKLAEQHGMDLDDYFEALGF